MCVLYQITSLENPHQLSRVLLHPNPFISTSHSTPGTLQSHLWLSRGYLRPQASSLLATRWVTSYHYMEKFIKWKRIEKWERTDKQHSRMKLNFSWENEYGFLLQRASLAEQASLALGSKSET